MKPKFPNWTIISTVFFLLAFSAFKPLGAPGRDADARPATPPFDDHQILAQRFRPYYKYSVEPLHGQEQVRPISWQSFVHNSELWLDGKRLLAHDQMQGNGTQILGLVNSVSAGQVQSDVRPSRLKTHPYSLHIAESARPGDPWDQIINQGAGLYVQVEEAGNNIVVLTYWSLYAYNSGTGGPAFDHDGDLAAVSLVYDRTRDMLIRANFVMHGAVLEQYDLQGPASVQNATLTGINPNGTPTSVNAHVLNIAPDRRYQNGPSWHSPSRPSDVYLVADPTSGKFEHLAVFVEWGTHEGWPNTNGSVTAAPQHNGKGVSFLPAFVRFVGSVTTRGGAEDPFFFFNGVWGDPPGPIFHPISFNPSGPNDPIFIPQSARTDRDPYTNQTMSWPPTLETDATTARVTIACAGDKSNAQVAMRWGHPDFNNDAYFPLWTVKIGQSDTKSFTLTDKKSEFEIQTEGGVGTTYTISIWIDTGNGVPAQPSIVLKHSGSAANTFTVSNPVAATRSSGPNQYGEQNIRVTLP
jgi:hypothetical protein